MRTRGYIDGIFGTAVRGWVVDLDDPAHVPHVVVRFDGQEFEPVAADEPRADLARAGIGSGLGGWRVHIGTPPRPGTYEIVALVAGTATAVPLAQDFRLLDEEGSPRDDLELYESVAPAPAPAPPPLPPEEPADGEDTPLAPDPAVPAPPPAPPLPGGEPALAGEAGWLFRCPEEVFTLIRGVADPDRAALDRLAERVASFQSAAVSRGAVCLVAVLPDKLHVYPEHAPARMALYPVGRVAEHLAARLQDTDDGLLLDLLPALLRARAHGRVFSRAGTGPTWLGAFHAYRAIAKLLAAARPALRPRPVDALRLGEEAPVTDAPHDGPLLRWQGQSLVPDGAAAGLAATATEPALGPDFARAVAAQAAPRALIAFDGPSRRIAELLGDHCTTTFAPTASADAGLLPADPADIVVWLLADASLAQLAATAAAGEPPKRS